MPSTPPGFLVLDDALAASAEGEELILAGEEGRHAAKVARIGVGERVLLTDAPGRQVLAEVTAARKEALELRLLTDPSPVIERLPRLTLVQALATGGRDEQAVESATELGVDRIVPWIAQRSVSVWRGDKLVKGRAKWSAVARAAVKQCRRAGIPAVDEPVTTARLAADASSLVTGGAIVLALHEQESVRFVSLCEEIASAADRSVPEIVILVGPEGGISDSELDLLRGAGVRTVLLGSEVLRTSTAGPATIALVNALTKRW